MSMINKGQGNKVLLRGKLLLDGKRTRQSIITLNLIRYIGLGMLGVSYCFLPIALFLFYRSGLGVLSLFVIFFSITALFVLVVKSMNRMSPSAKKSDTVKIFENGIFLPFGGKEGLFLPFNEIATVKSNFFLGPHLKTTSGKTICINVSDYSNISIQSMHNYWKEYTQKK